MLSNEMVREVLKEGQIRRAAAEMYLPIYVGKADWNNELRILRAHIEKQIKDPTVIMTTIRKIVCATILLPMVEKSTQIDPDHPEILLHRMPYYQQLPRRDWYKLFKEVFQQDVHIDTWRAQTQGLGYISPIQLAPITRQAYNWLYEAAEQSGVFDQVSKEQVTKSLESLVTTYGGAVICNIFSRHDKTMEKILNWRTGYFFERVIFEVYKPEEVFKIKESELNKTNSKLVHRSAPSLLSV